MPCLFPILHVLLNNLQAVVGLAGHLKVPAAMADGDPVLEQSQGFPVIDPGKVNALNAHGPGHLKLGVEKIGTVAHAKGVVGNKKSRDALILSVPPFLPHGDKKRI